jgi:F-type H+-transporting ATPase subunit delta
MPIVSTSKRYAQAIFAIARERTDVDLWKLELWAMEDVLRGNSELRMLLSQAAVPMARKAELIREVFKGVSTLAQNVLCLLAQKGRLYLLPEIARQYGQLVDAYHGREQVTLVSATPLDEGEQKRISGLLRQIVQKEVVLDSRVEPDILGGLVIRIGDRLIDGSVKGRLLVLRRQLVGS